MLHEIQLKECLYYYGIELYARGPSLGWLRLLANQEWWPKCVRGEGGRGPSLGWCPRRCKRAFNNDTLSKAITNKTKQIRSNPFLAFSGHKRSKLQSDLILYSTRTLLKLVIRLCLHWDASRPSWLLIAFFWLLWTSTDRARMKFFPRSEALRVLDATPSVDARWPLQSVQAHSRSLVRRCACGSLQATPSGDFGWTWEHSLLYLTYANGDRYDLLASPCPSDACPSGRYLCRTNWLKMSMVSNNCLASRVQLQWSQQPPPLMTASLSKVRSGVSSRMKYTREKMIK